MQQKSPRRCGLQAYDDKSIGAISWKWSTSSIQPLGLGYDLRTFECSECPREEWESRPPCMNGQHHSAPAAMTRKRRAMIRDAVFMWPSPSSRPSLGTTRRVPIRRYHP